MTMEAPDFAISPCVRIPPSAIFGLLVGLGVTFAVYSTGNTFGIYEGFWGLLANILALVLLNPIFVKKTQNKSNPIMDQLFTEKLNSK